MPALRLPVLITGLCLPLWASAGIVSVADFKRNALRDAVEAHRAATRAETERVEAWAGRRLTPAELAELREQVRRQSAARADHPPAPPPVGNLAPPVPPYFPARSQRP